MELREPGRPNKLLDGVNRQIYVERKDWELLESVASNKKPSIGVNELIRRLINLANINTTTVIEQLKTQTAELSRQLEVSAEKLKLFDVVTAENKTLKEDLATKSKEMDLLISLKNHQDDEILKLKKRAAMWWTNVKPLKEQTGGETR